jgi:hypothetical protein
MSSLVLSNKLGRFISPIPSYMTYHQVKGQFFGCVEKAIHAWVGDGWLWLSRAMCVKFINTKIDKHQFIYCNWWTRDILHKTRNKFGLPIVLNIFLRKEIVLNIYARMTYTITNPSFNIFTGRMTRPTQ